MTPARQCNGERVATEALPDATARLRTAFARIALAAALLTFVVITASAFMRHTQAGLACADWPACYGRMESPGDEALPSPGVRAARIAHRIAATGVLVLVIGMLLVAWTQRPAWRREGLLVLAALVVAIALAVLGLATPGARVPAITLGNLLGGYLMLALLAATVAAATPVGHHDAPPAAPTALARRSAFAVLGLALLQAASGGIIGAQYALTTCPTLGACADASVGALYAGGALDPLRPLSIVDSRVVPPAGAAGLHVAHRLSGIAVAVAAALLAWQLRHGAPRAGRALGLLALGALALGSAAIAGMPSRTITVLHNATVAAMIAVLAHVAARNGTPGPVARAGAP